MQLLRWLLFPITILYTLIILVRNKLYDIGFFKSKTFPVNTIVIGNLAVGGAGKSPLTQLLISHFQHDYRLATLSRGYGRSTKGFRLVNLSDDAATVGDEPLQFKKNFPNVTVAVDENRAEGIEILQKDHNLIILDDAFQHRKITGTCQVLVFDFVSLLKPVLLLPTGNFRDSMNQTNRADVVLISKCPPLFSDLQKLTIEGKIKRYNPSVRIFYSSIEYLAPISLNNAPKLDSIHPDLNILLLTGIANPLPLVEYLQHQSTIVQHLNYPDHHAFSSKDYEHIQSSFEGANYKNKIILTTEKDAQRIDHSKLGPLPIYYLPIRTKIDNENDFFQIISSYVN